MLIFYEEAYYRLSYGERVKFLLDWKMEDYSGDDNLDILDKFLEFGTDHVIDFLFKLEFKDIDKVYPHNYDQVKALIIRRRNKIVNTLRIRYKVC